MKRIAAKRTLLVIVLSLLFILAGCAAVVANRAGLRPAQYGLQKAKTFMVPMRDNIRLATDVYLPRADGPFPVILVRTPYSKGKGKSLLAKLFASRGYAYVVQDTRGRYDSEGRWYAFHNEGPDGEDTFRWVRRQKWCNGKVGLYGLSYFGYTQWQTAHHVGDDLTTWVPGFTGSKIYDIAWRNGVFHYLQSMNWCMANSARRAKNGLAFKPASSFVPPLVNMDNRTGRDVDFYNDWVAHPTFDAYWRPASSEGRWDKIDAPAMIIGGWYDLFLGTTLSDWDKLNRLSGPRARKGSRLFIGPWTHGGSHKMAGVDYGREADFLSFSQVYFDWFDQYLLRDSAPNLAKVNLFTTGKNQWQRFAKWPPADAQSRIWYLHSGGRANRLGDGKLNRQRPGNETTDRFTHDPENLVPTIGGPVFPPNWAGPADARSNGERNDVLVYTSAPFDRAVELTGPVEASLWFSADTADVDLAVTLLDVDEAGTARVLTDGIMRARYRNGNEPTWLRKNEPIKIEVDCWAVSHQFRRGHRLRIHIAASNFPRFAPNPCTRADAASTKKFVKAKIKILHDADHPSAIVVHRR